MRRISGWAGGASILALVITGSACGADRSAEAPVPLVSSDADRPTPGGDVVRRCGSHHAAEFDPGLEERTVVAGPVSLVAFRVATPVPEAATSVGTFKVMVRLEAGAEATVETVTPGTALFYDRARFDNNPDQLTDGDRRARFVGCPDGPAIFNGAVLTDGPTTLDLAVVAGGRSHEVQVAAFAG